MDRGINSLADVVVELQNDEGLHEVVKKRVNEFKSMQAAPSRVWYEELVYCLLTAYSSAELGQRCLDSLCTEGLLVDGTLEEIVECVTAEGHRFANQRSEYIHQTRHLANKIKAIITGFKNTKDARNWLKKNIKGIGWKESSHYLRNVGYLDLAIIDRHILSNMKEHGLIEDESLSLTKRRYLRYEGILKRVAKKVGIPVGEMDLYLWYRKTGEVLK
ncbi:MAG: N-glycosylase/DNA lyase [Candidatus Bathyarchaeia archaeon]